MSTTEQHRILSHLGNISVETFLTEYWQKKPLLIRQAFPGFESPLSPDEIAGLSLEEDIESRIILEDYQGSPWQLRCGPFTEEAYQQLPEKDWTLLVQALDHYIPEVTELLNYFRFIPSWRLDDIMVSYAVDGGSVGPHYDHYDVFLLQGQGQRHWQLGQLCDENSETLKGTNLNILQRFDYQEDWVLEPGDMLYLPPKYAHWGIAKGECITYSVGFRAPNAAQLLDEHSHWVGEQLNEFQRYEDKDLLPRPNFAEILPQDIDRVVKLLNQTLDPSKHRASIAQWFGQGMTQTKYPTAAELQQDTIELIEGSRLEKNPAARLAYYHLENDNALLFINGQSFETSLLFARNFSQAESWKILSDDNTEVLQFCLNNDIFFLSEE